MPGQEIAYKLNSGDLLDHYRVRITGSWMKLAETILETGRALLDAERDLPRAQYRELKSYLTDNRIISETVISKLRTIASNSVLAAPENTPRLPSSYATLYELARKDEQVVQSAIDEEKIFPEMELKDVQRLFSEADQDDEGEGDRDERPQIISIRISGNLEAISQSKLSFLASALDALKDDAEVKVTGLKL